MNAVGYARYSTDNQTENSIEYQINAINDYCKRNKYKLIDVYSDEAKSGTNTKRNGLQRLLTDCTTSKFSAVIIYDQSRLSRNVVDWFTLRETLNNNDITLCSCTENIEDIYDSSSAFLSEGVRALFNQQYVLDVRRKSKAGVTNVASKGLFCGGTPPLGYDIIEQKYIINKEESLIVKKIFEMYAAGKSYDQIIMALDGARGKMGRVIGKNSLNSILSNERYIGTFTWNKRNMKRFGNWAGGKTNENHIRIEDNIPAIIDRDIWERVRIRMSDNKRRASNKAKREYILSGLIECGECGSKYIGHCTKNQKGYENRYYVCGNKYRTKQCHNKNINADELELAVVAYLKDYLSNADFDALADELVAQVNGASTDLSKEKRELSDVEAQINNGTQALLRGIVYEELENEIEKLRVRRGELQDIIFRGSKDKPKVKKEDVIKLLTESLNNFDRDHKEAIKAHITKIYANVDGSISANMGVHINGCGGRI